MPFRSAGTLLVVRADRLGKTGAMWGNTLSLSINIIVSSCGSCALDTLGIN